MNTQNTQSPTTAICLSFNYCTPTDRLSTLEQLHKALLRKKYDSNKKKQKANQ